MPLEPGVLALVLFAAALHAGWNALVKAGGDRLVMTTLVMLGPTPICFAAVLWLPLPDSASWPFLAASAVLHYAYYALLIAAYSQGDLSQVYPISRGAAPALVALGAWIFAGEALSSAEVIGVLIVSAGIMSLAWRRGVRRSGESRAVGLALINGCAIASYLVVDGIGVRRAGEPFSYIAWLFLLEAAPLVAFTWWRRRGRIVASVGPRLKAGLFGGVIAGISYGITLWALNLLPMAHIVALRETSVLMGAAMGVVMLKEPFGAYRIAAAAVVAIGATLLTAGF